ncbi:uncharacterized protein BT62DRAFT_999142 [Guyanagaster necrorhizus]|uniref:Uncharacterized protein n=1 Tax=Guyanagaster necrorhizus TaxID=856835 RepID=A0A9P8AZ29_9AGAR|nr:uncharacterized protein BT62DRAFT_999142 [Guyanagaster necrorhizus MCA 3950]KAG7453110.1 hypothetical protein BT62DRAFT_999142 [Guyanagaster necrorhizus MCA 3950]
MTLRPPSHLTSDESTVLRASVFDVFVQLGALEQNSPVAEWMFSDPESAESSTRVHFAESNTGSRFRERFDSDCSFKDLDDSGARKELLPRSSSRASRFLARMRSTSRTKSVTKRAQVPEATSLSLEPPKRKRTILRFKSRSHTNLRAKAEQDAAVPPVPQLARAKSVSSPPRTQKPTRPSFFRSKTQLYGPSDDIASVSDNWEEISPLSSPTPSEDDTQASTSVETPFLDGLPENTVVFPSSDDSHPPLFRSFSEAVYSAKRLYIFPARRTQSKPEPLPHRINTISFDTPVAGAFTPPSSASNTQSFRK